MGEVIDESIENSTEERYVFAGNAATFGLPFSNVFLPRELHRYHNVLLDSFEITWSEMEERVQKLTRERELPWLNIAWMEEECRKYPKLFSRLLGEN